MLDRRDFVKSLAAVFAAAPILPSLDLVKQNLGEVDNDSFDSYLREIPPLRQRTESIVKDASFADIIAAANDAMLKDTERYGFSYSKIFEAIKIEAGQIPEFPLDFLAPQRAKNGLSKPKTSNPVVYLDTDKSVVVDAFAEDYLYVPSIDFEGDWIDFEISNAIGKWDRVSAWVQVVRYSYYKKVAKAAWDVLMAAAKENPVLSIEDFTDVQRMISLCKVSMRRNGSVDSTSIFRNRATDLYVPTHTFFKIHNAIGSMLDQETVPTKFEWHFHMEPNILDPKKAMSVFGVRVQHAPELSWYDSEKDFGVVLDAGDSFVNIHMNEPTMFHKQIQPWLSSGMAWNTQGFAVLNSNKVMLAA